MQITTSNAIGLRTFIICMYLPWRKEKTLGNKDRNLSLSPIETTTHDWRTYVNPLSRPLLGSSEPCHSQEWSIWLTQIKNDYTTNSHYLTYTFLYQKVGRMYFFEQRRSPNTLRTFSVVLVMQGTRARNIWCFLLRVAESDLTSKERRKEM